MSMKSKDDYQLLTIWIEGNDNAYQELFNRYFKKLYYYTLKLIPDTDLAEEIVLDVMLNIWQKKHLLNAELSLSAYLFKSVKNKLIDQLRRKTLQIESMGDNCNQYASNVGADDALICKELEDIYQSGVAKLPPQKQLIFKMKREDGLTYNEIAIKLNLSKNTVENHMGLALKFLKNIIKY
ncbi:MAG: RNA polymerase sigma-70 factor [Bacteroidota bacterium]